MNSDKKKLIRIIRDEKFTEWLTARISAAKNKDGGAIIRSVHVNEVQSNAA